MIRTRALFQCSFCKKQYGVFGGTIFQGTRLSPFNLVTAILHFWDGSNKNYRESFHASKSINELLKNIRKESERKESQKVITALRNERYSETEIAYIVFNHGEINRTWKGPIGVRDFERLVRKDINSYSTTLRLHKKLAPLIKEGVGLEDFIKQLLDIEI